MEDLFYKPKPEPDVRDKGTRVYGTGFRLTVSEWRELAKLAEDLGISRAQFVRESTLKAIDEYNEKTLDSGERI